MSVNRELPHVLVLPEDKANNEIANGFSIHPQLNYQKIQILKPAGGWMAVVKKFKQDYESNMRQYPNSWMVLLIDFDTQNGRFEHIYQQISNDLRDRVFILGVLDEPEVLRRSLQNKSLEAIGEELSENCSNNTDGLWGHQLLRHNKGELERMISTVKPFLFNQGG